MTNAFIIRAMIRYSEEHNEDFETAELDGHPFFILDGYNSDSKIRKFLDKNDDRFDYGYSDEYCLCYDCYKVIRTQPNSYNWVKDFYVGDGFIVCNECLKNDYVDEYIDGLINDFTKANTILSHDELTEMGFEKYNTDEYECGLYEGQNDNPFQIYNKLKGEFSDILFSIGSVGQFDTHFDVYVR